MANEFVIKNGYISQGNSYVNATLSANTVQILTTPTLNNSNTQVLSRNSSTGSIEYLVLSAVTSTTTDTYVTGFTYNSNLLTISQNQGQSPLSVTINTMTGLTINGNLSTTSISPVDYIDFNTGATITNKSGRLFYDNVSESLAYNSTVSPNVSIKLGQQLYTRVVNNTGSLIPKGSAVKIQTASNGIPEISLAIAEHIGNNQVVGLVANDILNTETGLILNQGILSGVTISYPIGSILYLSDTIPGDLVASISSLSYDSRTNQVGYTIATGTTEGAIYVSINNEDINLSLTDIQRNILEGNTISTGAFRFTGLTRTSATTFDVAPLLGWVVKNTGEYATLPDVTLISYSGVTNQTTPYINSDVATYVLITSGSTLLLQPTFPTPQERRQNIFLGRIAHPDKTSIITANNTVDFDVSPMSALRDLWTPFRLINEGVIPSPNGANLSFNTSSGTLWGNGIGLPTNELNPNSVSINGSSPVTFQYRVQTGGTYANTTFIDPANYDNGGTVIPVGGGSNSSTNQRIYLFPSGQYRVQYGQTVYSSLSSAVAGSQTEGFVTFSNNRDNAVLIGILSVNKNATDLSNTSQAVFNFVSKFGEILGGTGGLSTTTLQQAYNNSSNPEIVTNVTQDGLQLRDGTNDGSSKNIIIEDFVGNQTAWITAGGLGVFSSIESIGSQATGTTSLAFGSGTLSFGDFSHAEGAGTNSIGVYSHSEGNLSSTGTFSGFLATSVVSGAITLSLIYGDVTAYYTDGNYIYFSDYNYDNNYASSTFLVSGSTYLNGVTEIYLYDNSVNTTTAVILPTESSGYWGGGTEVVNGISSHAEGYDSKSIGRFSHAEGSTTIAFGVNSHTEGGNTKSIGQDSHSEGDDTQSIGGGSHAEGRGSISYGNYSHAEGFNTKSIGFYSHSQGVDTQSIGYGSFSSGNNSISSGDTSFIHSTNSIVTGDRSVVLGGQNITGSTNDTVYVSNFNIFNTPITNNSGTDLLVRDGNGDIGVRDFNSINYTPNLVTVGLTGGSSNFNSIKLAVDSITGASSTNPYVVIVGPGVYYEDPISMKSYVVVVGDSSTNTIIEAKDSNQTLLYGADQSMIQDCQIQGCTGTGVSAIVYSSSTVPQLNAIFYVENVRFGANYTHVKNVGTLSGNSIVQCSNVKYGGYPFTLGFHATNDGSGVGRIQLRNVTSTNGGVTTQPNLVFAKADKPSCALIVNGCLLTKAVGAAAGTGFWVEDGGSLRLTGVNFQRWVTGIYAPQSGSSPSIDAIALNFEGCTTDVNIVHSGATGKIQGTDSFLKTKININAPLYEVNTDPREIIVAKKGGDFSSIKSAVDYLAASGNTSSTSRYVISVGPGEFYEDEINLTNTPYVSIVGSNIQTTQILPNNVNQHLIKVGVNNEISFLSFANAPSGYAAIYCDDIGDFAQAHKCSFYDCDTNVWVKSSTQDTKFYGEYLDFNGTYTYGTRAEATNNYLALANIENYYNFPTGSNITYCNWASGSGATLNVFVGDQVSNGISGTTSFYIKDGAELNASTITSDSCTYGIWNPNIGSSCRFDVDNASFVNGEWDLYIENPNTFGTFGGSSSHEKIYTVSQDIYWSFLDIEDGELDITIKASVTFGDGTHTDFTTLLFQGSTMGLMEGGAITVVSGLTVSTAAGFGYLTKTLTPNVVMRIDWVNSQITLGPNENKYIYINENSILSASGTKPSSVNNIILGRVITNSINVSFIDLSPVHSDHTSNRYGSLFRQAMGPIYATGSIVTESTSPFNLNVTSGEYYYSSNDYQPIGGSGVTFTQYYRDGLGSWVTSATTVVNNISYDGNGVLSALTTGYYTKHTLYLIGDGTYENYFLVLGQNEYSSLVQTENALLPTPPTFFSDAVTQVANIYIQQGFSGITQIEDIRPTIAFRAGGVNASSVHGNLLGLSADDHTQYLLVDGGRAMAGNLDMGGNSIVSAGTINNVTIQSHATRHQFNGSDPVGSVTPGPNYIPYADVNSKLDSWVSDSSTSTKGLVTLSTTPTSPTIPIALSITDDKILKSITGITYSLNVLSATTVDGTVRTTTIGLKTKANSVAGTSFAGNPKKYTVVFTTPYPNTNYSVSISANVNRTFTWESKTVNGFTINTNSNTSFTENVDWVTTQHGES